MKCGNRLSARGVLRFQALLAFLVGGSTRGTIAVYSTFALAETFLTVGGHLKGTEQLYPTSLEHLFF